VGARAVLFIPAGLCPQQLKKRKANSWDKEGYAGNSEHRIQAAKALHPSVKNVLQAECHTYLMLMQIVPTRKIMARKSEHVWGG
jgi:hypothetical protein